MGGTGSGAECFYIKQFTDGGTGSTVCVPGVVNDLCDMNLMRISSKEAITDIFLSHGAAEVAPR